MMRGVNLAYLATFLCYYSVAISGYAAFGNEERKKEGERGGESGYVCVTQHSHGGGGAPAARLPTRTPTRTPRAQTSKNAQKNKQVSDNVLESLGGPLGAVVAADFMVVLRTRARARVLACLFVQFGGHTTHTHKHICAHNTCDTHRSTHTNHTLTHTYHNTAHTHTHTPRRASLLSSLLVPRL